MIVVGELWLLLLMVSLGVVVESSAGGGGMQHCCGTSQIDIGLAVELLVESAQCC